MTDKPFSEALDELLREKEWSLRQLAAKTREESPPGIHHATLSPVMRGESPVTVRILEACAKSLRVKPEHFAEYRLERARAALDWRRVGLAKALRTLQRFEST